MRRERYGIRGPTWSGKANDRAGNAAVGSTDRGGSGTNQPSRVSRKLAPAFSVGGNGGGVKVHARHPGMIAHEPPLRWRTVAACLGRENHGDARIADAAGNRVGIFVYLRTNAALYEESGTYTDE